MSLRTRIVSILRDSDTGRIRFSFEGTDRTVEIDRNVFLRVADAIEANEITIQEGGVPDGVASYNAHNGGGRGANTLYIGGQLLTSSRNFNGLMIHEAVHAYFDLEEQSIQWIDNEVAAYIAQGYYFRNSGFARVGISGTTMPYYGLMIVEAIRSGEDANGFWMQTLRNALNSDPLYESYINSCFQGDG